MSANVERTVHANFPHATGTIAIVSSDNVVFFADRVQLARTSGFFRGMLDLPQPDNLASMDEQGVPMPESAQTLEILLSLAMADREVPLHKVTTLAHVMPILLAAEKYEVPLVLDVACDLARTRLNEKDAAKDILNLYAMAIRCEWAELKAQVFQRLLRMRLQFDSLDMSKIDSQDLAKLFSARVSRISSFTAAVGARRASARICPFCRMNNPGWVPTTDEFFRVLTEEFINNPAVDDIVKQGRGPVALGQLQQLTCFNSSCTKPLNLWNQLSAEWKSWA